MSTAVLVDDNDLDLDAFREMASGLLTNIDGAKDAIDTLAEGAQSSGGGESKGTEHLDAAAEE